MWAQTLLVLRLQLKHRLRPMLIRWWSAFGMIEATTTLPAAIIHQQVDPALAAQSKRATSGRLVRQEHCRLVRLLSKGIPFGR